MDCQYQYPIQAFEGHPVGTRLELNAPYRCNLDVNAWNNYENVYNSQLDQYTYVAVDRQVDAEPLTCFPEDDMLLYLDNCSTDFNGALESFAKLADQIQDHSDVGTSINDQQVVGGHFSIDSPQSSYFSQNFSPNSISATPQTTFSTTAPTTTTSTPLQTAPGTPCWPLSPASSGRSSASGTGSCGVSSYGSSERDYGTRRKKNASAAGKYRRRLKGRQRGIHVDLEMEEIKNRQLRHQLESKLDLYREFVDLLAQNTNQEDTHLASKGLDSLRTVLSELRDQTNGFAGHEQAACDLHEKYVKFQEILRLKQF